MILPGGKSTLYSLIVASASFFLSAVPQSSDASKSLRTADAVPNELLVKLRARAGVGFTPRQSESLIRTLVGNVLGDSVVANVQGLAMDPGIQRVTIADSEKRDWAIAALRRSELVQYAEPNFYLRATRFPNDVDFEKQWNLANTGQADPAGNLGTRGADIHVVPVWARGITGNRRVIVAVLDTGVDRTHPDLAANIYTNPGEAGRLGQNGKDDDANGVIDDLHGANFVGEVPTGESGDDNNHGTHCAGVIGARGNDGRAIAGINWDVSILPVKFLDADGVGTVAGAVNAVKYAVKMHARILSNSWGGDDYSEAMADAIREAGEANALFVVAAGNDAQDLDRTRSYPASYALPNVLTVGAVGNTDLYAQFSNFGTRSVHVAAPGVNIYSTIRGGAYANYSGSSMACPHVAGMAALLLSHEPKLSAVDLKDRLIRTSTPVRALRKFVLAGGTVNMENAIDHVVPPNHDPDPAAWVDRPFTWESAHPYANDFIQSRVISVPGARYVRVVFSRVDLENDYDTVKLLNSQGEWVDTITGEHEYYVTDYASTDKIILRFQADVSGSKWGFRVEKIQAIF